jgi:hypothetical protein
MSPALPRRVSTGDNDIDLEPDELGGDLLEVFAASIRPAILDHKIATLDPAKLVQTLNEFSARQGISSRPRPRQRLSTACLARHT